MLAPKGLSFLLLFALDLRGRKSGEVGMNRC